MILLIISVIISPILAFLLLMFLKYRFPKGYFGLLIRSYFWGIFSSFIAGTFFFIAYKFSYLELTNLRRILFYSFFIIGFGQELGKFLVLRYLMLPSEIVKSPSDGIIYSLMISFGAISIYNVITLLIDPSSNTNILISHSLVSITYAVIMGFFVGLGKLRKNRLIDSLTGLFGAVFFHGVYEFILQTNDQLLLWPFLIGSTIITFLFVTKSVQISDQDK